MFPLTHFVFLSLSLSLSRLLGGPEAGPECIQGGMLKLIPVEHSPCGPPAAMQPAAPKMLPLRSAVSRAASRGRGWKEGARKGGEERRTSSAFRTSPPILHNIFYITLHYRTLRYNNTLVRTIQVFNKMLT